MMAFFALRKRLATTRADMVAGLAGLLIGSAVGFGFIVWNNRINPVIIYSAYERDGIVYRRGHIDIVFNIDRIRDCPAQTSRWIWTWVDLNGTRVKQFFPLANTNAEITDRGNNQHFILSLTLPSDVWPGDWFYVSKTIEDCSLFPSILGKRIIETPEIPFRILDDP